MSDSSIKKRLRKIIVQGYSDRTLGLFKDIIKVTQEEFREDNIPTIAAFLVSHLFRAFEFKDANTKLSKEDFEKFVRNAMISELSQFCGSCSSLYFVNKKCVSHGVTLETAKDYPDIYRCPQCLNLS